MNTKLNLKWCLIFLVLSACVEQIEFDVPPAEFQTVIEGMISDGPGPYTVLVSKGISLNADSAMRTPIQNLKIALYDDQGNAEKLFETNPGVYNTTGIIRGQVGRSYYIVIETQEGKIFKSEPEMLNPVGEIEDIRFEFEPRIIEKNFGILKADVFNVYIDSDAGAREENYVRWRFKGTYKVDTHPELHQTWIPPYTPFKNPAPCSGYRVIGGPDFSGGLLEQVGECTCCTCWAAHYESMPQLSDSQLISSGKFKNIKVGEVPINNSTFHDRYGIEIEQMSLTRKAFEFFKLVRDQKAGASSLFQPPSGEIRGNIQSTNSDDIVVGIFWATSVRKKSTFIFRKDVPYPVPPIDFIADACDTYFRNSSNIKPAFWE